METRYLKTFLEVLESGSFSRAAVELNITQSAVSQRIKFMEEQYGTSLIDRSGAVIVATEAGGTVLKKAQQILALEIDLDNELKSLKTKARLSIGCTPTFGVAYLPKVLSQFFLANSEEARVKSHVNTPERVQKGILGNEYDVAVIEHCYCLELDSSDIVAIPLPPDELALVSAPSSGLSGKELSLPELLDQRLITRREGCSSRSLLESNLTNLGRRLDEFQSNIIHDDLYLTIQSALSGLGVAFISRKLIGDYLENGSLVEHTVEGFSYCRSRSIIFHKKRSESECVKKFIECAQNAF